jgi:hypothetical protein
VVQDRKLIAIDVVIAPIVKRAFELYSTGRYSLSELRRIISEDLLQVGQRKNTLSKSALHKMLTNPFYHGDFWYDNVLYQGIHEPLITVALFDRVQERLIEKSHQPGG